MEISQHTLETLEFDKIRARMAARTASDMGRETVEALTPTDDPVLIDRLLRPVLECVDLIAFDAPFSIHRIPDARRSLMASATPGSVLTIPELLEIGEVLDASHHLLGYMSDRQGKYPRIWEAVAGLSAQPDLEAALQRALDPVTEKVKDSASPELRRIRRGIESLRTAVREQVEAILNRLPDNVVQDRLVTIRDGRYVIPVRENQKHRVEGIVHDQSASGATLFLEPMGTVEQSNRLRQLELAEQQEVRRILRQLSETVGAVHAQLMDNLHILGAFDAIYAKAAFARDLGGTEPVLNQEGRIVLRGARHPLLVFRLQDEARPDAVVPLDLTLGNEDSWTLVLTGPNAGGKTVALKAVGLLALMAQAGLPIPAQPKSELPVFSEVFADIGDAQSIENDLSTFSSHVANLVDICKNAGPRSLILLDEIGGSTDPDEGSALAMALLQNLTLRGCRILATTHHGALKAFAHDTPGMANGSMAFDTETLRPTFQLRQKVPGSSYAFEIARRLGMPDPIVDEAVRMAGSGVRRVESLIAQLDETYRRYNEASEQAEANREELTRLTADYESRLKDVERRERELKRTAQEEARSILANANALIERTVEDIRHRQADTASIRHARDRIQMARKKLDMAIDSASDKTPPPALQPGDRVWVAKLRSEGAVLTPPADGGRVLVEVGNLKVELSPGDLELREKAASESADSNPAARVSEPQHIATEIDLRGLTFEEAADVVDKYLDDLFLARMEQATLIHGKGTGALRRKLGDFLKHHPRVTSQRLGGFNEGGSGVTIVKLDTGR